MEYITVVYERKLVEEGVGVDLQEADREVADQMSLDLKEAGLNLSVMRWQMDLITSPLTITFTLFTLLQLHPTVDVLLLELDERHRDQCALFVSPYSLLFQL